MRPTADTKSGVSEGLGPQTGEIKALLDQLFRHTFLKAKSLIRFHETLLFLRAFPQSASLVRQIENLLNTFHSRVENLRNLGVDMSVFDEFDTSGIAGTTNSTGLAGQSSY